MWSRKVSSRGVVLPVEIAAGGCVKFASADSLLAHFGRRDLDWGKEQASSIFHHFASTYSNAMTRSVFYVQQSMSLWFY